MSQDPFPVIDVLKRELPAATFDAAGAVDMPTFYVDPEHVLESIRMLRDHPELQFAFLVDLTAVDYLPAAPRYEVVYILACLGEAFTTSNGPAAPARRLRMKTRLADSPDPRVASVTSVFPSANWPERPRQTKCVANARGQQKASRWARSLLNQVVAGPCADETRTALLTPRSTTR